MAGRGTDIKLGKGVKESGGLAIIGTERHDSRRVDRQLRGRAGRQGDPGSSQFFVSLEDNLMRLFGSDRVSKVMDRFGYEEGEVIQHSMITKTIERSQKKVEQNNFGIRKRLLEYDDVMNKQRVVIYTRRKNALYGDRLSLDINNALYDWVEESVNEYKDLNDYHGFKSETLRHLAFDPNLTEEEFNQSKSNEITQNLFTQLIDAYNRKNQNIKDKALVVFNKINKERGKEVKNILVPFSDGKKSLNVSINLKKAIETNGEEIINAFERYVALAIIDENWKDHLRELDDLKQSANNASIEQKDPLLIYKLESFNLFQSMISSLNSEMTSILFKGDIATQDSEDVKEAKEIKRTENRSLKTSRASEPIVNQNNSSQNNREQPKETPVPVRAEQKVGRNDDCPCGSGKKYKKCHGKNN
jgi:preprotein translocase subunit SecA